MRVYSCINVTLYLDLVYIFYVYILKRCLSFFLNWSFNRLYLDICLNKCLVDILFIGSNFLFLYPAKHEVNVYRGEKLYVI